jgi:hypothetical protein
MLHLDLTNTTTPETAIRFKYFIDKNSPYELDLTFTDNSFCKQLLLFANIHGFILTNQTHIDNNISCKLIKL